MANPDQEQQTRLDDKDAKALLHDFVYREDMDVSEVAQYIDEDWDNAYRFLSDQLKQARIEDDE